MNFSLSATAPERIVVVAAQNVHCNRREERNCTLTGYIYIYSSLHAKVQVKPEKSSRHS